MARALQYFVLILILGIPIHECTVVFQDGKCIIEGPCFDLNVLANMAERVSKDVIAADGEKILLKHTSFDKIRKKKNLHSCVVLKIINLFQEVLDETEKSSVHHKEKVNYHHELIHIMEQLRNCVYKGKYEAEEKNQHGVFNTSFDLHSGLMLIKGNCDMLYKKSEKTSLPEIPEKEMNPKQLAVLQLQKLKNASERLSDVHIQERVMDELKTLHLYMRGKGFRKNTYNLGEA